MLNYSELLGTELQFARYLVLELAGVLDRLDDAAQREKMTTGDDPRLRQLVRALRLLQFDRASTDRVEQILRLQSEAL